MLSSIMIRGPTFFKVKEDILKSLAIQTFNLVTQIYNSPASYVHRSLCFIILAV